jgi:hypothetical protein
LQSVLFNKNNQNIENKQKFLQFSNKNIKKIDYNRSVSVPDIRSDKNLVKEIQDYTDKNFHDI